jgi:hypothetical protein
VQASFLVLAVSSPVIRSVLVKNLLLLSVENLHEIQCIEKPVYFRPHMSFPYNESKSTSDKEFKSTQKKKVKCTSFCIVQASNRLRLTTFLVRAFPSFLRRLRF